MSSSTSSHTKHHKGIDPHWKGILECAAIEVFNMMAGLEITPFAEPPGTPAGEQTAIVGLAGALCGMITVRCSSAAATKVAANMLGGDAAGNPSMISDAMGEVCNMVAGNFKAKVSSLANDCMLSVPTVITGDNYAIQTVPPSDGFELALSLDGEPVWFTLITQS